MSVKNRCHWRTTCTGHTCVIFGDASSQRRLFMLFLLRRRCFRFIRRCWFVEHDWFEPFHSRRLLGLFFLFIAQVKHDRSEFSFCRRPFYDIIVIFRSVFLRIVKHNGCELFPGFSRLFARIVCGLLFGQVLFSWLLFGETFLLFFTHDFRVGFHSPSDRVRFLMKRKLHFKI